jgi:hypothetical protein
MEYDLWKVSAWLVVLAVGEHGSHICMHMSSFKGFIEEMSSREVRGELANRSAHTQAEGREKNR